MGHCGSKIVFSGINRDGFFMKNHVSEVRLCQKDNFLQIFEDFDEKNWAEINYADSVFIFLALVKELQKRNNISEIYAFKKVYIQWWQSGREGATRELLFEEVFGFSLNSFNESLKFNTPDLNTVLPSENIRLEEIFEEL